MEKSIKNILYLAIKNGISTIQEVSELSHKQQQNVAIQTCFKRYLLFKEKKILELVNPQKKELHIQQILDKNNLENAIIKKVIQEEDKESLKQEESPSESYVYLLETNQLPAEYQEKIIFLLITDAEFRKIYQKIFPPKQPSALVEKVSSRIFYKVVFGLLLLVTIFLLWFLFVKNKNQQLDIVLREHNNTQWGGGTPKFKPTKICNALFTNDSLIRIEFESKATIAVRKGVPTLQGGEKWNIYYLAQDTCELKVYCKGEIPSLDKMQGDIDIKIQDDSTYAGSQRFFIQAQRHFGR